MKNVLADGRWTQRGWVVCGCRRAGTTARANALTQIVPNLSSLYTLFYSVIYNSVIQSIYFYSDELRQVKT